MLRWGGIAVAVLVVLGYVAARLAATRWEADVERELAAIEASGAPLRPEDLVKDASSAPAWWTGLSASPFRLFDLDLDDLESIRARLEGPDESFAPIERGLLERLAALHEEGVADDLLLGGLTDTLPVFGADPRWTPAHVTYTRVRAAVSGDLIAAAPSACDGPGFDARSWIDAWLASDAPVPTPDAMSGPIETQKALARRAWLAALDGDERTALESLRLGTCTARAYEEAPGQTHALAWCLQNDLLIRSLVLVAQVLPETDLAEFEPLLFELDTRERLRRALEEERAIGYAAFSRPGDAVERSPGAWLNPLQWLGAPLQASYDRAVYFETYSRLIAAARGPSVEAREEVRAVLEDLDEKIFALRSQLLVAPASGLVRVAYHLEARATLARAVLVARSDGLDAARAWILTQIDPFSGDPYRVEIDAGGALRASSIWSWDAEKDALSVVLESR